MPLIAAVPLTTLIVVSRAELLRESEHFSLLPLFLLVIFSWLFWRLSFFDFCGCLELTILGGYYLNQGL